MRTRLLCRTQPSSENGKHNNNCVLGRSALMLLLQVPIVCYAQVPTGTYTTTQFYSGVNTVGPNTYFRPVSGIGVQLSNANLTFDPSVSALVPPIGITTTAATTFAIGLYASNSAVTILAGSSNMAITTSGVFGYGIYALGTSTVTAANLTLRTSGQAATGAWISGSQAKMTLNNSTITTSGPASGITGAYAVLADNGGTATVSNSVINSSGSVGAGIIGDAGTLNVDNTAIHTTGTNVLSGGASYGSYGINVQHGTNATVNGGSILTEGVTGTGLRGSESSTMSADSISVETRGNTANGVAALSASKITTSNVTVLTTGLTSYGASVTGPGSTLAMSGGSITTTGNQYAHGVIAKAGGAATLINPSVSTSGISSMGIVSTGSGSSVQVTDGTTTTSGQGAHGLYVEDAATLSANGLQLTTQGLGAVGVVVDTSAKAQFGADAAGASATITTSGAGSDGVRVGSGGVFSAANTIIHAQGAGAHGISLIGASGSVGRPAAVPGGSSGGDLGIENSAGGPQSSDEYTGAISAPSSSSEVASLSDGTLTSDNGAAIHVSGPDATVNLTHATVTGGTALIDVVAGATPGISTVNASASTLTGRAATQSGSTSNLSLQDRSIWNVTADSNLTDLTNSASLIAFTPPSGGVFKTLTATNYTGSNGVIALNTVLGGDGSPSDKLVVSGGSASGNTGLRITNAGGAGAVTLGNGIEVVDATNSGTTAQTAFVLSHRVVAGPYEYTLQRSSVDGSNDQAWYLRSTEEPMPPTPPTPPEPPEPPRPNYRPETSLYSAVPAMALVYSRALIDTLHERVGEERRLSTDPLPTEDQQNYGPSLGWGRLIYRSGEKDQGGSASGSSLGYNYDLNAFQVGLDLYHAVDTHGATDLAGLSLSAGTLRGGVTHTTRLNAGDDTLRTVGLGGYWTHFGPAGWYVDGVLQFNHFDVESRPNEIGKLTTHGWGYTASLEGGYPFEVKKDLFVEPQAQLIYTTVDLDSSSDIGADVRFKDVNSLIGRLGVRIAKDWFREDKGKWLRTNAWVRPSVWREFKGQPKTEFSSESGFVPFESDIGGTFGEVNLGLDVEADKRTTFYVSAGYQQAFDGNSHGYEGMFGVKVAF
ncbi:autotransporter outer membrane beta-barrel domain-containing protein [Pseudomonas sp. NA-150]|uniref:autotransporter outer membrane beta-barrel domain-containing protein n=1 Tax=Pseudomonas sp. NA-150 TaxID=3367525 RepID=UPI0037CA9244